MLPISDFPLPASVAEAKAIQASLRQQLILEDRFERCELIAGIDVGYDNERGLAHASIVTMPISNLHLKEQVEALVPVDFPYIPGLLSFREIPAILVALAKLKTLPDLLMVDGMGIAHPRRMGIAAHLGVHLNMPSIGVGKSRLTGRYEMPCPNKGSHSPLMDKEEQIGIVLRSRDNTNPLFISPGHRVSMETALAITLRCLTRFRLPEPTRMADKLSKLTKSDDLFAIAP